MMMLPCEELMIHKSKRTQKCCNIIRSELLEFKINMSEMPLGKLSKENIQKGFEALTEIQNLLSNEGGNDSAVRESLLIDSSNRFFTLIPSIHPHVIRHDEEFKAKVKMLEALQDIEIASRLVGFDGENDESLDEKYKKLQCDLTPLPHHSEDYKLVEKYLINTHAPTHKDWTLELEEVFTLEREGEFDKYAPYRETPEQDAAVAWLLFSKPILLVGIFGR